MPLRALMGGRHRGERPGLPVRQMDVRVVAVLIAAGLALTGIGLVLAAFTFVSRRD